MDNDSGDDEAEGLKSLVMCNYKQISICKTHHKSTRYGMV